MQLKNHNTSVPEGGQSVLLSQTPEGDHVAKLQSALTWHQKGHFDEAEALYREILCTQPGHFDALQLLATIAAQKNNFLEAVALFDQVLKIKPDHPGVCNNYGNALRELKRYEEALLSYERALALKPDYAEAYSNRGVVLKELKRYEEALLSYDRALALKPFYADAYSNRGVALKALRRYEEALLCYDKAIALKPDLARAHYNRGIVFMVLKRYEEAIASLDKAFELRPDFDFLCGRLLHSRMQCCDWRSFDDHVQQLSEKIEHHEKASTPFTVLAIADSPALQKKAALIYVHVKFPERHVFPVMAKRSRHEKIRIGYFSADYHDHPMMYLMAGLFEMHDRNKFELLAFSFGPDRQDEMRKRAVVAFDHFIDVRDKSDREIVQLSRDLEVDIAVDRKGFTTDSRTGIFALRAAPIQVNYLAYPGTMGAAYIDYLIADEILIPASSRKYYTEKIVSLPDSYQVNDATRRIADKVFTREECGLPERGFVFCCFNNNYKITPGTFDGWMRILNKVPESLLWLIEGNPKAADNLRREAAERGVHAGRLIFAKRLPHTQHLARHRLGDLFLDTLPCNAHTTASDALWAGLPVLTCMGESFAGRVAASLLNAIQLPELITFTQEEYEARAVELATNPEKLVQIRHKLEQNRLSTPLFDTRLFTRHIEAAYRVMYERYQHDLPPEHLFIKRTT